MNPSPRQPGDHGDGVVLEPPPGVAGRVCGAGDRAEGRVGDRAVEPAQIHPRQGQDVGADPGGLRQDAAPDPHVLRVGLHTHQLLGRLVVPPAAPAAPTRPRQMPDPGAEVEDPVTGHLEREITRQPERGEQRPVHTVDAGSGLLPVLEHEPLLVLVELVLGVDEPAGLLVQPRLGFRQLRHFCAPFVVRAARSRPEHDEAGAPGETRRRPLMDR